MAVKHEIKTVELAKLVPYEKNPNVHPIEQSRQWLTALNATAGIILSSLMRT